MRASGLISNAAWLLLLGTVLAAPPGKDAADNQAVDTTATTTAPAAADKTDAASTPDDADGPACHNTDGPFKPFCLPKNNDAVIPGATYYITWDPSFFPGSNTTLKIIGFYATESNKLPSTPTTPGDKDDDDKDTDKENAPSNGPPAGLHEAFSSEPIDSGWGFWQWRPDAQLLKTAGLKAANITLRLVALPSDKSQSSGGSDSGGKSHARWFSGPTVLLKYKDKAPPPETPSQPHRHVGEGGATDRVRGGAGEGVGDRELYVVLPLVFGVVVMLVVATFVCNRGVRRVDLSDVLRQAAAARRRKLESRSSRRKVKRAEESIRLMEQQHGFDDDEETGRNGGHDDWEAGWGEETDGTQARPGRKVFERDDRKLR